MYTGIVQAMCPLTFVERAPNLMRFGITLPPAIADEVTLGASIAINGCCFTVTSMDEQAEGLASPSACSSILVTVKQQPLMAMLAPSVTSSAIAGGSVMPKRIKLGARSTNVSGHIA